MIFSTERVSANTFEAFLFIGFLLIFAIAASAYVWTKGLERGMAKGKLLLDCVLIITSVVPPELPMELSLAVNASLVALQKFGKWYTSIYPFPLAKCILKPFSVPSLSVSHGLDEWMSAVSTRQVPLLVKTSLSKVSLVSSEPKYPSLRAPRRVCLSLTMKQRCRPQGPSPCY